MRKPVLWLRKLSLVGIVMFLAGCVTVNNAETTSDVVSLDAELQTREMVIEKLFSDKPRNKSLYVAMQTSPSPGEIVDVQRSFGTPQELLGQKNFMNSDNWRVQRRKDGFSKMWVDKVIYFEGDKVSKIAEEGWYYLGEPGAVFVSAEEFGLKESVNQWVKKP